MPLSKNILSEIREIVDEFFQRVGFDTETEIKNLQENIVSINLKMSEPKILIGEKGRTLAEIQHLLRAIVARKIEETVLIDLDISDYKKKKYQYLKELARSLADEVSLTKREKVLFPMPASERRIVHLELAARTDITTESIGKDPERKIVISPYP